MKKYVITGSIGHISKPIVQELVKHNKEVSVITSNVDRLGEIEKLGAKALIGSVHDSSFVKAAFKDADVIYTMIPPIWQTSNWRASQDEVAKNYEEAIKASSAQYVVNLSSIGADVGSGVGPVDGVAAFEKKLNALPVKVKHLRPSYFFYNFFAQLGMTKGAGILGGNFGDTEKLFLVHTNDIAEAATEELLNLNFKGNSVRYVIGDERSGEEIADVLGRAVGKPLKWVVFTDEQQKQGLLHAGLSETHAENFTQMGKAMREGIMQADARRNKPVFSKTKLEDFAKEFASVYNQ
ncbi:NmrA family NAD(P)-binding protein [Chryseosolibacter indicus]|uniref:NAD(P)H-binding protein n=1 Tax=Chryseosolibacter indicus TaxID=2782351 RepID=A0ABS5VPM2_9BACT|nr:NAD(P)H-binding protein [Chryseosolibacter indicus]MBT1701971.1 NAD(P)H-binding protein [Chryseosolibacter indicus]